MKVYGFIQARLGSSRLPGKMLKDLHGRKLIDWVYERSCKSKLLDKIVVLTSDSPKDDPLVEHLSAKGIPYLRGSEDDVLSRFVGAIQIYNLDHVVRICGDNPLVSGQCLDELVTFHLKGDFDYSFNHIPRFSNNYPDGLGAEIVRVRTLLDISQEIRLSSSHKEHVTSFVWDNLVNYKVGVPAAPSSIANSKIKLDIDTRQDYDKMERLISAMENGIDSSDLEICVRYKKLFL